MKTDGIFTAHKVTIEAEVNKPFKIIPFGDIHRDSDMFAHSHWQEFLCYAKQQKGAVFLGMGDYTDGVSTSERIVLSDKNIHDTTKNTLKNVYKGTVATLANELAFMRGRVIGILGGNHYFDFGSQTTDHLIASALDAKYLGVCGFIRLSIEIPSAKKSAALDIFAHHGKGGGATIGSNFNGIEKMTTTADADIYLMGHTHGKGCVPSNPRMKLLNNGSGVRVRERTPWLGRTGSFLKAYESGRSSYNVDAGRSACALGWIEFEVTPVRIRNNDHDIMELRIRGTS